MSNWTRPAVTTMLSGLPPLTHGVLNVTSALPDGMATLPEIFAGAGFATAFLTANPNTGAVFGFDRGCDVFFDAAAHPLSRLLPTTLGQVAARLLLRFDRASSLGGEVMRFLDAVGSRRFFLVVHYNDPHTPYAPPDPFDRLFVQSRPGRASRDPVHIRPQNEPERQAAIALYDGEIASLDHALAAVIDQLRTRGLLDRTAMVFAADHGEEFDEHGGYGHGRTLFEEILRVPLLVRPPGNVVPASVEAAPSRCSTWRPPCSRWVG
ncbi:MAG: sulfatase-like hydrolase/transferase [Planctomycetota bacterium]